MVYINQFF